MGRIKLSENFYQDEFDCPCGKCGLTGAMMQRPFVAKLQRVRDKLMKPMIITSGIRCPAQNLRVGGSPDSRHLIGSAADVEVSWSGDRYVLVMYCYEEKMGGIKLYPGHVHLDDRRSPRLMI